MTAQDQLIVDVGFHNGDDTAYYLGLGFRVLAIEANPTLAGKGRERFSREIALNRLTILNAAVWERSGEKIPFYVNETDSGWSSIDENFGAKGGSFHKVEIETVCLSDLFVHHGAPWYLKIDIEGADEMAVRTLRSEGSLPKYLSFELKHGLAGVDLAAPLGYTGFKLINQETFTQNVPIFNHDIAARFLRKACHLLPPLHSAVSALPAGLRPRKMDWDPPVENKFSENSTGPFGEETPGKWRSADEMRRVLASLYANFTRAGWEKRLWFDLHARHRTAQPE